MTEPVFVAHGTADTTIAVYHGQRVYDLAPNPKGIWIEEGAGHADLWDRGIWDKAEPFFEEAESGRARPVGNAAPSRRPAKSPPSAASSAVI